MTAESLYSVTLKCGTTFDYKDLENANLSFVPCGITKEGKEKPLLKFGSLWDKRVPVKRESYGKRWNYASMQEFTGYQLMTGKPSYRRNGKTDYIYYVSLDIERSLIDRFPEQTQKMMLNPSDPGINECALIVSPSGDKYPLNQRLQTAIFGSDVDSIKTSLFFFFLT